MDIHDIITLVGAITAMIGAVTALVIAIHQVSIGGKVTTTANQVGEIHEVVTNGKNAATDVGANPNVDSNPDRGLFPK